MQDIEEEKKKAKIWMIISVIAILIGITLLVIIVIMLVSRSKPKHCPACVISPDNLIAVQKASSYLGDFKTKIQDLAGYSSDCNNLSIRGKCDVIYCK